MDDLKRKLFPEFKELVRMYETVRRPARLLYVCLGPILLKNSLLQALGTHDSLL
jgi:hypothetical protein